MQLCNPSPILSPSYLHDIVNQNQLVQNDVTLPVDHLRRSQLSCLLLLAAVTTAPFPESQALVTVHRLIQTFTVLHVSQTATFESIEPMNLGSSHPVIKLYSIYSTPWNANILMCVTRDTRGVSAKRDISTVLRSHKRRGVASHRATTTWTVRQIESCRIKV